MPTNCSTKLAQQDVIALYRLIGEAICMIQHLEGALSVSITLKKDAQYPRRIPKEEADRFLEEHRSITLGRAIKRAKENTLYPERLYGDLEAFLEERNWLVHKFLHEYLDNMYTSSSREKIFNRIKTVSEEAKRLRGAIEVDMLEFSESLGMDMSRIHAAIKQYSHDA